MFKFYIKYKKYFNAVFLITVILFPTSYIFATLSCSVTTAAACADTIVLRMSGSSNAHSELPSQSNSNYDGNVVCCSGITGLGSSCSGNYAVVARLSGVTNAHVEKNTEAGASYTENACLSSSFAGDDINIGYQSTNCNGYDTTLFSMSNTPTNSQVGNTTAYNNKVCAKISSQFITFSLSSSTAGFGNLTSAGLRYATSDGVGSSTETEAYSLDVNTNAPSGYTVLMKGGSLSKNAIVIDPIGGTNITPTPGTKAFGIRATSSGGSGTVSSPYDGSGFAYDADSNNFTTLAGSVTGDGTNTNYSVRSVATIDSLLDPGDYSTDLTYVVVPNF
jgi:hypothetical protein